MPYEEISMLINLGVYVYPVFFNGYWYVECNDKGVLTRFDKHIHKGKILKSDDKNSKWQDKIISTWLFYYNKYA